MAVIINSVGNDKFSLNGKTYSRIFQPLAQGLNDVALYNTYDTRLQILSPTRYSEFVVNGSSYGNQTTLIQGLLNVVFIPSTGGGGGGGAWGDITGTIADQGDLMDYFKTKGNLNTGYLSGLNITIDTDTSKFSVSAGKYVVTDFSDLNNIITETKDFVGATGITPAHLLTNNSTYISLDASMNIVQHSSPLTNSQRRALVSIGAVIHSNNTNIEFVNQIVSPIVAPTNQLHDFMKAVGALNISGNVYEANGANLKLNKSAGDVWGLGINGQNYLNPHVLNIPQQIALPFRYRLRNGTEYASTTNLNPASYDNGGVLATVPNNKFTVQHVSLFQSGESRIQYGQAVFDKLDDALAGVSTTPFDVEQNIAENAIYRAYIVLKKDATSLLDDTKARIIPVDKFGNVNGGAGYALTNSLITAALGYTPEDLANKVTGFGTINNILYPSTRAVEDRFSKLGHTHTFASLTSKPTTIAGFGITDAYTKAQTDSQYLKLVDANYSGDANNATEDGKYRLTTGATNIPANPVGAILINYNWDVNAKRQIFYQYASNNTYERYKLGAAWSPWVQVWNSGNSFTRSGNNYIFGGNGSFTAFNIGNIAGNHRIDTTGSGTTFRFLNSGDSYATAGLAGLSIGNGYAATTPPVSGAIIEGNVGIGKTNPSAKLDVVGNIRSTSNITAEGYIEIKAAYPQINFNDNVDTRLMYRVGDELRFRFDGTNDGTLWHSGNSFTKSGANYSFGGNITATAFFESSDKRLKTNIEPISDTFRSYEMKDNTTKRYGVIAQEIEETNPELVRTDDKGMKSVNYIDLLVMKMAEQENEIKDLNNEVAELKAMVQGLINKK